MSTKKINHDELLNVLLGWGEDSNLNLEETVKEVFSFTSHLILNIDSMEEYENIISECIQYYLNEK